jgi:hypothetical protein
MRASLTFTGRLGTPLEDIVWLLPAGRIVRRKCDRLGRCQSLYMAWPRISPSHSIHLYSDRSQHLGCGDVGVEAKQSPPKWGGGAHGRSGGTHLVPPFWKLALLVWCLPLQAEAAASGRGCGFLHKKCRNQPAVAMDRIRLACSCACIFFFQPVSCDLLLESVARVILLPSPTLFV